MTAAAPGLTNEEHSLQIEVLFWGRSGEAAMSRTVISVDEGTTLDGLFDHLGRVLEFDVRAQVMEEHSLFLTLNGHYCNASKSLRRALGNLDVIAVLPVVAGG